MRHNFKNLKVWQKSRELNRDIYKITQQYPEVERFGIVNQMRRASISVMSNIAEGTGRRTDKELVRFLEISYASALELESLLTASIDLEFISELTYQNLTTRTNEIQKMLIALIQNKSNTVEQYHS
jgi:four helix bundle protein